MNKAYDSLDQVVAYFKRKEPQYRELNKKAKLLLNKTLNHTDIKISPILSRIKKEGSLRDKIKRKNYSDPLNEITDFAGIRIVCGFESDFSKIDEIIYDLFNVLDKVDKTYELGVDKMGYHGLHYVVSLKTSDNTDKSSLKDLCCEIQVRTAL